MVCYLNLGRCTFSCGCLRDYTARYVDRVGKLAKIHPTHGRVLSYYKRNAKNRGFVWGLNGEQFTGLILGNCYFCGSEPPERTLVGKVLTYNGIDRLDNSVGYTPENSVSCCTCCNRAKLAMGVEEFKAWILRAARHLKLVPGSG